MKQLQTTGIILSRTDYGEADRIVTILTFNQGKLRLMARGVRKIKSRLAGGIELFSVSEVSYIRGRGEIGTMVSSRLIKHFGRIVQDIDRVQLGYRLIKLLNSATEDQPESEYFELLERAFLALDDAEVPLILVELWFMAQLLRLDGYTPNLLDDTDGHRLEITGHYDFDFDSVSFNKTADGRFDANQIKTLRLIFGGNSPIALSRVDGVVASLADIRPVIKTLSDLYIRGSNTPS